MIRVGVIRENGIPEAHNFKTRGEAEDFILNLMETENLRQARLRDMNTKIEEKII
jgi:hypothetical protein